MRNNQINKLEIFAREGFLAENKFVSPGGWQDEVIADVKRQAYATKFNKILQTRYFLKPCQAWCVAAISLAVALIISFSLYLAIPDINSDDDFLSEASFENFSNFDNYIEEITQL